MTAIPDDRQFYVSGRIWHEALPKFDVAPLALALHAGMDLRDYGPGLGRFYLTFIVMPPDDDLHAPYIHLDAPSREADVAVALPYAAFMEADEGGAAALMAAAYLEGAAQVRDAGVKGFDADAFTRDLADLFAKEGLSPRLPSS